MEDQHSCLFVVLGRPEFGNKVYVPSVGMATNVEHDDLGQISCVQTTTTSIVINAYMIAAWRRNVKRWTRLLFRFQSSPNRTVFAKPFPPYLLGGTTNSTGVLTTQPDDDSGWFMSLNINSMTERHGQGALLVEYEWRIPHTNIHTRARTRTERSVRKNQLLGSSERRKCTITLNDIWV